MPSRTRSARTRSARTLVAVLIGALLGVLAASTLAVSPAQASGAPPRVTGLTAAGEQWADARLKVRWTRVAGATYQVRWATSTSRLSAARVRPSTVNAATSPTLGSRCVTWYAQVRAVRNGRAGAWSRAKGLRFSMGTPGVPTLDHSTASQTNQLAAQVRWTSARYVARYRLDWSAAPWGQWAGFEHNHTPWLGARARGTSVRVPATPAAGDRFLAPAYGNPVFAQLNYDNGCTRTYRRSTYVPVFTKPRDPGAGDTVAIGAYNLEGSPTSESAPQKVANLADNIARRDLDIVTLQEASEESVDDLVRRLEAAEGQVGWDHHGVGAQQVLWRTTTWRRVWGTATDVGRPTDESAATPLRTPGIRLAPALGVDVVGRQDVFVVSVHLEDRLRFDADATVKERKRDAHLAARVLLEEIAAANPGNVPTLVAGDFKGNFGGGGLPAGAGYCDENTGCVGEGQPTFVRAGFWDAQSAVSKSGIAWGTVNKHVADPAPSATGIGGRPDFILARGVGGFTSYRNVVQTYGDASATHQSDHNLLVARLVVPRLP
ncbi:MAG TPA: hypothetical protein VNT31_10235 [Nocardioides sp.]|nr:hypothetical protein [Nocardioides sp.]